MSVPEPGRLFIPSRDDAERSGQGAEGGEAGRARGRDGLHPYGSEQALDRPHAW